VPQRAGQVAGTDAQPRGLGGEGILGGIAAGGFLDMREGGGFERRAVEGLERRARVEVDEVAVILEGVFEAFEARLQDGDAFGFVSGLVEGAGRLEGEFLAVGEFGQQLVPSGEGPWSCRLHSCSIAAFQRSGSGLPGMALRAWSSSSAAWSGPVEDH
jgi:hypothetical protein